MCYMDKRKQPHSRRSATTQATAQVREAEQEYGSATVGVRELRQNLSVYLDQIKEGRTLVVTEHGRHVALLRPLPPGTSVLDRLVVEGRATPPRRRLADILPRPEAGHGIALSKALQEMRDEDSW